MITEGDNGSIGFKCQHDSCAERHWRKSASCMMAPALTSWAGPPGIHDNANSSTAAGSDNFEGEGTQENRHSTPFGTTRHSDKTAGSYATSRETYLRPFTWRTIRQGCSPAADNSSPLIVMRRDERSYRR